MPISSKETKSKRAKKLRDAAVEVLSKLSKKERDEIKWKKLVSLIEEQLKLGKGRLLKKSYEKDMKELKDFAVDWMKSKPKSKDSSSDGSKSNESSGKLSIMDVDEKEKKVGSTDKTDDQPVVLREKMTEEEKKKHEEWWKDVTKTLNTSDDKIPTVNVQLQEAMKLLDKLQMKYDALVRKQKIHEKAQADDSATANEKRDVRHYRDDARRSLAKVVKSAEGSNDLVIVNLRDRAKKLLEDTDDLYEAEDNGSETSSDSPLKRVEKRAEGRLAALFEKSGVPEYSLEPKDDEVIVLPSESAQTPGIDRRVSPPLSESDPTVESGSARFSLKKPAVDETSEYESAIRMRDRLSRNQIVPHKVERTVPGSELVLSHFKKSVGVYFHLDVTIPDLQGDVSVRKMKEKLSAAFEDRGYKAKLWLEDKFVFVQPVDEAFSKRVLRQQTRRVLKELNLHEALTILDTGSTDGLGYMLGYPKKKYFGCQRTKKSSKKLNEALRESKLLEQIRAGVRRDIADEVRSEVGRTRRRDDEANLERNVRRRVSKYESYEERYPREERRSRRSRSPRGRRRSRSPEDRRRGRSPRRDSSRDRSRGGRRSRSRSPGRRGGW